MTAVQLLPSAAEWESLRPIVTKLYLDERLPLCEVMALIENTYNFKASSQMYKRRLARWGIRKYHKESNIRKPVELELERANTEKVLSGTASDSDHDLTKLRRYARRKGIALRPERKVTDLSVPISFHCRVLGPLLSFEDPSEGRSLEYLCWVLHGYVESDSATHQAKVATWCQRAGNTQVLTIWDNLVSATQHIRAAQYQKGAFYLSQFYDGAKDILEAQPVLLIRDILAMTMWLSTIVPDVVCQIVRHFHELSAILHCKSHPLTILLCWVRKNCRNTPKSAPLLATASALVKILRNYCLCTLGRSHTDTADCEILLTFWTNDAVTALRSLLATYDFHHGIGSYHSLHCLGYIQRALIGQEDPVAFGKLLYDLSTRSAHISPFGSARLNFYIRSCQRRLEAFARQESFTWDEMQGLCVEQYSKLAADEWKKPTLLENYC